MEVDVKELTLSELMEFIEFLNTEEKTEVESRKK